MSHTRLLDQHPGTAGSTAHSRPVEGLTSMAGTLRSMLHRVHVRRPAEVMWHSGVRGGARDAGGQDNGEDQSYGPAQGSHHTRPHHKTSNNEVGPTGHLLQRCNMYCTWRAAYEGGFDRPASWPLHPLQAEKRLATGDGGDWVTTAAAPFLVWM